MNAQLYPWIVAALAVLIAIGAGFAVLNQPAPPPTSVAEEDAAMLLIHLQSDITAALEALDSRLAYAAFELGKTELSGDAARGILLNLSDTDPAIVDCTASNMNGTILVAEPAAYHSAEGADLKHQPNVQYILATKRPIMSEVITVAEGFPAVVVAAPIFTNNGQSVGFTSIVFHPDLLIADVVQPAVAGTSYQVMVVQTDGRVLYDTDPAQIGRMTFDDPLYADSPGLQDAARRVTSERYGTATYEFAAGERDAVQKGIIWTTTGLHGVEWRVAVIQTVE